MTLLMEKTDMRCGQDFPSGQEGGFSPGQVAATILFWEPFASNVAAKRTTMGWSGNRRETFQGSLDGREMRRERAEKGSSRRRESAET